MKKNLIILMIFFVQSVLAGPIDVLSKKLSAYQSLQSQFHQVVRTGQDQIVNESDGQLIFKRPGQFFWKVNPPNSQLMVANGKIIWLYDEDLAQVTIKKQNNTELSPAALLSGSVNALDKVFFVTQKNSNHFILKPKHHNDESAFSQIELFFQSGRLSTMILIDQLGQISTFEFTQLVLNRPIPASQFEFVIPLNTDVIRDV